MESFVVSFHYDSDFHGICSDDALSFMIFVICSFSPFSLALLFDFIDLFNHSPFFDFDS